MQRNAAEKTNWLRVGVLGFGALIFLAVLAVVARDARQQFVDYTLESDCEAGEWDACGTVALEELRDGLSFGEKTRGMERMKSVCERGYDGACRLAATFQGRRRPTFGGNTLSVLREHRDPRLRDACLEGSAKACFAAAHPARSPRYDGETVKRMSDAATKLCATDGDMHSCRAASLFAQTRDTPAKDADRKACAHGFANSCESMRNGRPVSALTPEEKDAISKACRATGSPLACAPLAEVDAPTYRSLCWNADWSYCDDVELADDDEHVDAKSAFYETVAKLTPGDVVGYSIGSVSPGSAALCEEGVAEACFLAGADLVDELHSEWTPEERPAAEALEATFGRACELGMNAGCLAIGTELLNRPPDQRDITTANEWLDRGCENGNVYSCWMRNFENELRAGKNESIAQASLRACQHDTRPGSACEFYIATLEHELGATPWVMSDRRMAALNLPLCWEANLPKACRDRGWAWDLGDRPTHSELPGGLVFAAYADVRNGCLMSNAASCYMMLDAASNQWPVPDAGRATELRRRVCERFPDACPR